MPERLQALDNRPRSPLARRFAPAKINLYLHVGAKRADGFHALSSLVVFADAGDEIVLRPSVAFQLNVTGLEAANLSSGPDNLVARAHDALKEWAVGHGFAPASVALTLHKTLPVASGIGGGSADAAATLLLLADHWRLPIAEDDLAKIGLALGSDVPVCLRAEPCMMSGMGDIVEPVKDLPDFSFVLANPRVEVKTSSIFAKLEARTGAFPAPLQPWPKSARDLAFLLDRTINDLASPAMHAAPIIQKVEQALLAADGCLIARMSGSGATCFGLFAERAAASTAVETLLREHPTWWVADAGLFKAGSI